MGISDKYYLGPSNHMVGQLWAFSQQVDHTEYYLNTLGFFCDHFTDLETNPFIFCAAQAQCEGLIRNRFPCWHPSFTPITAGYGWKQECKTNSMS